MASPRCGLLESVYRAGPTLTATSADVGGDAHRRTELRKHKRIAAALLGVAAGLFVASIVAGRRYHNGWVGLVQAIAEAALIGGLADWYAVVALFRHPVGIRLPHTAIIPRRKDAIGRSLADFICDHFLDGEHIIERVRAIDPGRKLADYLSAPASAQRVANVATDLASRLVVLLDGRDLQDFVWRATRRRLATIDVGALLARALDDLTRDGRHREAVDSLLHDVVEYVHQSDVRAVLAARIADELWAIVRWVKLDKAVADNLAEKVSVAVQRLIHDMAQDENHPLRQKFDRQLPDLIDRLRTDAALRRKVDEFRDRILANREVAGYVRQLCTAALAWVRTDIANPESRLRHRLADAAMALGNELARRGELREWFNQWLLGELAPLADRYRDAVRAYIVARVKAWSAGELTDRLELSIGSDLQWIRYNGTLVGAAIGGLLYGLAHVVRLLAG